MPAVLCARRSARSMRLWNWKISGLIGSLLAEILKDKDFFMDSGGGITLSGGEPAIHAGFLKEFLPLAKREGVHINMETCGMFEWDEVKNILSFSPSY